MNKLADAAKAAVQVATQKAVELAPAEWLPGGTPDRLAGKHGLIGASISRIDGPLKVAGKARFAAEVPLDGKRIRDLPITLEKLL